MLARHSRSPSAIVQHRFVTINRQRFHYFTWGEGGPPIVLVHGTGFHGYVWKPVAHILSADGKVLAFDQRGHGDSAKPEQGYAWEGFAEDLHQFLTLLDLAEVTAVGHSAGATAIALCAACHPGRIRRAVLVDPILFPHVPDAQLIDNPMAHRARKRRMVWESRTSMFHSYRVREPFKTWREDVLWAYIEEGTIVRPDGHIELKCPATIEAQVFEHAVRLDSFGVLPQVNIPVLLMRGESSEAFPEASATRALSLLPRAQLKTVARASHFVPMERPEAVARAVRKFMSR
jgi:pimeloyl-ACP methyl ester carboxylesterase